MRIVGKNVTAVNTGQLALQGGTIFWNVNINTGAAGAVLKIYDGVDAATGTLLATIDCGTVGSLWYGIYCPKGLFYAMSVANADVTIGYA